MAPMTAPMNPAESQGWYQPTSLPSRVAKQRSGNAQRDGDQKAPGILPGHQEFGSAPAVETDDDHPQ